MGRVIDSRAMSPRLARWLEFSVVWFLLMSGLAVRYHLIQKWRFAGSDTYGYLKLADELRLHHRYAMAPEPEPLAWVRPPLFPIFLALAKGDARADMHGGEGWKQMQHVQIWLEVLGTGLLAYFLARRMAGTVAAAIALALVMFWPPTVLGSGTILTECIGTLLYTAAIVPLVLGKHRPRVWFPIAGALVALSMLLRPDALLLSAAFIPAIWWVRAPRRVWRERVLVGVLSLTAFSVVFSPWPVRNYIAFKEFRPIGGRIDRYSRPVQNYEGFWAWLRAWAPDWQPMTYPTTCYYDLNCRPWIELYDGPGAFETKAERVEVERLFTKRAKEGLSLGVSQGFQKLADEKIARHRFMYHLGLPVSRAWNMWVAPFDELLQGVPPWPELTNRLRPAMVFFAGGLFVLMLASSIGLSLHRRARHDAAVLVTSIFVRTAILAYTFYCMPRYAVEQMPIGFVLVSVGLVEAGRELREFFARRRKASRL